MGYKLWTKQKYDFFEVSSAMQKSIRRADTETACYFAVELWESNFHDYVWKRLFIISAEDCAGIITKEIVALKEACYEVTKKKKDSPEGRLFVAKAVILLCQQPKSRDADHLCSFGYMSNKVDSTKLDLVLVEIRKEKKSIPECAYDCHTMVGRRRGKTKKNFFEEEYAALKPKQTGLFDHFIEKK